MAVNISIISFQQDPPLKFLLTEITMVKAFSINTL